MPRITDFCSCLYVLGCKLSLVRLCDSDFGITPVDGISVGITCAGCLLLPHREPVLGTCFVCRLLFWRDYVYLGQLCLSKRCFCFLIHKSYVRSIEQYCFIRKYAAIPVQLEIFILQYIGWYVLIIWTFIFNQFGCFCQFLMDTFG